MPRVAPRTGTPNRLPDVGSIPGVSSDAPQKQPQPGTASQDIQTPQGKVTVNYKPYATANGIQQIPTGIGNNIVFSTPVATGTGITGDAQATFTYQLAGTELKAIPISVSGSIQQQITGDFNGQKNVNLGTETLTPQLSNGIISLNYQSFEGKTLPFTQTIQVYNPYNGTMQNVGITKQLNTSFNPDTNQVNFTGSSFTPYDVPIFQTPQVTNINLNGTSVPAVYNQTLNISDQGISSNTGFLGFASEGKIIPTVTIHSGDTLTNYTLAGNQIASTSYATQQLPAQTITTTPIFTTQQFNGVAAINAANIAANLGQIQYNIGSGKPNLSTASLDYTIGKPEQVSYISKTAAKNIKIIDLPTESLQQSLTTSYIEGNLPGFIKGNGVLNELAITAATPIVSLTAAGAAIKLQNPAATPLGELPAFYAEVGLSAATAGLINYPQFLGTNQRTPTGREALTIGEQYVGSFLAFGGLTKGVGVLRSQLTAKITPSDLTNIRENYQRSQDIVQTNTEQPQSTSVVLRTAQAPNSTSAAIETIKGAGAVKVDYVNELTNGRSYYINQEAKPIQFSIKPETNQATGFKNVAMDIGQIQQGLVAPIREGTLALPKPSGYELQFKDTSGSLNALTARAYTSYTSGAKGNIKIEQVTQSRDVYGTSQTATPEFSVLKSSSGKIIELTATKNTSIRRVLGIGAKTTKLQIKNEGFNYDIGNANTGFLTEKTGLGDTSIMNRELPMEQAALRTDLGSRTGFVINRGSTSAQLNQLAQERGIRINGEVSGVEAGYKFSGQPIRFIQAGKIEDIQTPGKQFPKSTYSSIGIKDLSAAQDIFDKAQNKPYTGFKKPESTYSKQDIARIDTAINKNAKGIAFLIKDIYTGKELNIKSDLTPADLIRINEKLGSKEYAEGLASLAKEIYTQPEKTESTPQQQSNTNAAQKQEQVQTTTTSKSAFVPRLQAENIAIKTEAQAQSPIEIMRQGSINLNRTKNTTIQKSITTPTTLQSTKRKQDTSLKNLSTSKAISTNESIVRSIEKAATIEATTAKTLQTTKQLTIQTTLTTTRTPNQTAPKPPPDFALPLFFGGDNKKKKNQKTIQPFNKQKQKYKYIPDLTSEDFKFYTSNKRAYSKIGVFRPIFRRGKK